MQKQNHFDKISKKDKQRHFSHELYGGKGSHARKSTKESRQKYRDNYDRIFGSKKV